MKKSTASVFCFSLGVFFLIFLNKMIYSQLKDDTQLHCSSLLPI